MDLIVGFVSSCDNFTTCVFSGNYNETIMSKRAFANLMGDEIKVLSIFLGKGALATQIHKSLQEREIACKTIGWFQATPGQIVDEVHYLLNPSSMANTFSRSINNLLNPADIKGDVGGKPEPQPDKQGSQPDGERMQPRRRAKPVHSP